MFGIDVSQFQGMIDWDRVKPQIDFAILRLGWIGRPGSRQLDTMFERNYAACKRLQIPAGVYVYCYSDSVAGAENGAVWALDRLWGRPLQMPVYIDMEDESLEGLGRDRLTDIIVAFNSIIERGGLWAGVYANLYWYNELLNTPEIKRRYTTWVADYSGGPEDKFRGQFDMWQYSSTGRIEGIEGDVDSNILYRDLISDIKNAPRPSPRIRYTVQPGDTLSAIAFRFYTTWQEIARINGLRDPNLIFPGQVLTIG